MNYNYDFERQERKERFLKFTVRVLLWAVALVITAAVAWLIIRYAVEITNVADNSMSGTLELNDTILINKLAFVKDPPERFDVIVFKRSGKEHSFYSVKRVIGLPGETVMISSGEVYIDGVKLEEAVNVDAMLLSGLAREEVVLDENEYFVLGDNRNDSEDSRFADVGNIVLSDIVGKAVLRTNNFGIVDKLNLVSP